MMDSQERDWAEVEAERLTPKIDDLTEQVKWTIQGQNAIVAYFALGSAIIDLIEAIDELSVDVGHEWRAVLVDALKRSEH